MKKNIQNLNEMKQLAKEIAINLQKGDIICLDGDLGAGKTTLTQFLAKYLGVKNLVTSPTFTIVKTYQSNLGDFNHIDAYRLENVLDKEMFDDYIYHNGLTIIEWSKYLDINKKVKRILIKITGKHTREVDLYDFNF